MILTMHYPVAYMAFIPRFQMIYESIDDGSYLSFSNGNLVGFKTTEKQLPNQFLRIEKGPRFLKKFPFGRHLILACPCQWIHIYIPINHDEMLMKVIPR